MLLCLYVTRDHFCGIDFWVLLEGHEIFGLHIDEYETGNCVERPCPLQLPDLLVHSSTLGVN